MAGASSRDQWAETAVGAAVLAAAAGFLIYALGNAGGSGVRGGYEVVARFGEAGALAPGADVRVAGLTDTHARIVTTPTEPAVSGRSRRRGPPNAAPAC